MARFRTLRLQMGLSQTEFRSLYNEKYNRNYTAAAISQIERGKRMPELGALLDFADFYGVSLDYLLERNGKYDNVQMSEQLRSFVEKLSAESENQPVTYGGDPVIWENVDILKSLLQQSAVLARRLEKERQIV